MTIPTTPPAGIFTDVPGGLRLHHYEAGEGRPVVFIHGSGPGASGFSNFKHNVPAFAAAGYRAIVVDLPGYGQSSKPADVAYTLDFFVSALHAQLTALGLGPAVLLGNSPGVPIALKYAHDHPAADDGLISMAPAGHEVRDPSSPVGSISRTGTLFPQPTLDHDTLSTR
ncbi:alpha/beta fold hydrolase, partial [Burkholderia contaminans]